ncbi:MAG: GNAT family N-acetyltransferase [Bdellovibrio sp.]
MELIKYERIEDFLRDSEDFLMESESLHNLILGLASSIRDKEFLPRSPLFYSVKLHEKVIACALLSSDERPLMLTRMPSRALNSLVEELVKIRIQLVGVVGDERTCVDFKDQWVKINNLAFRLNTHLGVYECREIIFPEKRTGKIIRASSEHKGVLRIFIKGFLKDFCPNDPELDSEGIESLIDHHLKISCLFLLQSDDNEIVSMAANIRSTHKTQTIGFVYTPAHLRGLGYGSNIVALLSEKVLREDKKIVNLFTDLKNSTSNSIYQKLGYVKIGQDIQFDFLSKES